MPASESLEREEEQGGVTRRRGGVAVVIGVLSFLVVGSGVSLGYRATMGQPYIEVLSEKAEDYAANAGAYDLVFLGSSLTFRHVDPEVFDAELRACGLPVRSYNFGVPAMREPELRSVAELVLRRRTARLRYVVLQDPIRAEGVTANMMSDRGRYFRGWERAPDTVRDVICYTGTRAGQARRALGNAKAIAAEQIGLGRLARFFTPITKAPLRYDPGYREARGFWPSDRDDLEFAANPELRQPMSGDLLAEALGGGGYTPSRAASECRARQLLDTVDRLEQGGLEVFYFISPNPREVAHDRAVREALERIAPDLEVLDLGDPRAHPEYFALERWNDVGHLDARGAAMVSRDLGRGLCARLGG